MQKCDYLREWRVNEAGKHELCVVVPERDLIEMLTLARNEGHEQGYDDAQKELVIIW